MRSVETDVLIVGAGPAGLAASAGLAMHGIDSYTIARHPGTAHIPRATTIYQRTVEVFRDFGLEQKLQTVSNPLANVNHNVLATTFAGIEIARYRSYGTGARVADYAMASPCVSVNSPQHVLEPVLLAGAIERGASINFSNELIDLEQDADGVIARVKDLGTDEEYSVSARYAIGADGARSRVAKQLGIEFVGEAATKHMYNVWLEVNLAEYAAHRPGVIYQMVQPGNESSVGAGSWICVEPWDDWVLVREYDPADGEPDTSDDTVIAGARKIIGDPEIPIRVKGVSKWQVNHLVATDYRKGRVFLAGDAAHRHPPSGGLGANTSIQDSFNLAWKLAFVLRGAAGEELLDSYQEERHPIGEELVERTNRQLENQAAIAKAIGFRRGQSAEEGWAALEELYSDAPGAAERREALAEAIALQNYRSNAHGVELGQRYTSRAVVDDGTPFPEPVRDPELYYQPTTHPGASLPHAWVEHERRQVSTLDLAGHGRFCLIVGIGGEPWADAAAEVAAELGIELPVFFVGLRCEYDDVVGDWAAVREIDDRGALLVRPDRHIAWRAFGRSEDPAGSLRDAIRQVLDLSEKPVAERAHG